MRPTEEIMQKFKQGKGNKKNVIQNTRRGQVDIRSVAEKRAGNVHYLEIELGSGSEGGDPHFRIFNPPVYVEDPEGTDLVRDVPGRGPVKYRRDPLEAVAQVIAEEGGRLV